MVLVTKSEKTSERIWTYIFDEAPLDNKAFSEVAEWPPGSCFSVNFNFSFGFDSCFKISRLKDVRLN